MRWWEILIIVIAVAFVLAVIVTSIVRRKRGKTSCGCDCAGCSGCTACEQKKLRGEPTQKADQSPEMRTK